jgi:hypothetical protein
MNGVLGFIPYLRTLRVSHFVCLTSYKSVVMEIATRLRESLQQHPSLKSGLWWVYELRVDGSLVKALKAQNFQPSVKSNGQYLCWLEA